MVPFRITFARALVGQDQQEITRFLDPSHKLRPDVARRTADLAKALLAWCDYLSASSAPRRPNDMHRANRRYQAAFGELSEERQVELTQLKEYLTDCVADGSTENRINTITRFLTETNKRSRAILALEYSE